eukprot:7265393-Prymnesium_polylepis.2
MAPRPMDRGRVGDAPRPHLWLSVERSALHVTRCRAKRTKRGSPDGPCGLAPAVREPLLH